jgi:hypothetical protein
MDRRTLFKAVAGAGTLAMSQKLAAPALAQGAAARMLRFVPQSDLANFEGQRRQRRRLARARARCLAQGRAGSGAIDAAADGTRSRSRPQRPARPAARAAGHRSAWPSAARARIRRRLHGEGAGRDRRPARTPHHRGVAPPLRRRAASAGGARLHRAALEGLLSNATSRTSSRAPARLPASEILLLGVAAEFRCGSY